jgi:hypothetical protein
MKLFYDLKTNKLLQQQDSISIYFRTNLVDKNFNEISMGEAENKNNKEVFGVYVPYSAIQEMREKDVLMSQIKESMLVLLKGMAI